MKKIFLYGDFDLFQIGGIKYLKGKGDFLLLNVKTNKNFKSQKEVMIESLKYIPNSQYADGILSMRHHFKNESPDFLAIVSGNQAIATVQEFNKTKMFCNDNKSELVVINTFLVDGLKGVMPYNIYDKIGSLLA